MMAAAKDGQEVNFLGDDTPAVLSSWTDMVYLTHEEAKALRRQLHALLDSYEPGPGRRQYALRIGLAPVRQRVSRR